MENRELIYELAERLGAIIEVIKDDKLVGNFKFINGKLHKLKDEKLNNNTEEKKP